MNGTVKFILGAVATSLLAMVAHSAFGGGERFISALEDRAHTSLAEAGSAGAVTASFIRDPALRRFAVLSGTADAAERERLLRVVRAIPGVAGARWAEASGGAAGTAAPATPEQVASCQGQVDAAIAGQTIQFDRGYATISASSSTLLDSIATALAPCEGVTVEVAGHTDASGTPGTNQTLSEARAQAVVAALTERQVPAGRLVARGYGATRPKVEGRGAQADAANRRIEFSVSAGAAAPSAGTGEATP